MTNFFNALNHAELKILDFITEKLSCPFLDSVLPFASSLCDHGEIWIVAAIIMLLFAKTRRSGIATATALIMGLIIGNLLLKPIVGRIRPYELTGYPIIVPPLGDYSFPSGHTLASFEAAGAMMFTNKRIGIPALVLAFIIAFSRLYLYVHYPTDVLAGIVLGMLFAYISVKLTDKLITKNRHFT